MSAPCPAPAPDAPWEVAARELQIKGDLPGAIAHHLNALGLLDTRRGRVEPWTPTTLRHALNAAGRFRGPRWAAGHWTAPAEAVFALKQPEMADLVLNLAEAGEHFGTIAEALNERGPDPQGEPWTAARARALAASARALVRDREAAALAVQMAHGPLESQAPDLDLARAGGPK